MVFDKTLSYLSASRLDARPLVTGRVSLDELPARFDALMGPTKSSFIRRDARATAALGVVKLRKGP